MKIPICVFVSQQGFFCCSRSSSSNGDALYTLPLFSKLFIIFIVLWCLENLNYLRQFSCFIFIIFSPSFWSRQQPGLHGDVGARKLSLTQECYLARGRRQSRHFELELKSVLFNCKLNCLCLKFSREWEPNRRYPLSSCSSLLCRLEKEDER